MQKHLQIMINYKFILIVQYSRNRNMLFIHSYCIIRLIFYFAFQVKTAAGSSTAPSIMSPGGQQPLIITDMKSFTITPTTVTPIISTWTFPNGYTTTDTNYQVVLSITTLSMSLGIPISLNLNTTINNKYTTSIGFTVNCNPNYFATVGYSLLVIDASYSPYMFLSPQIIMPNQNPLVSYTGVFSFIKPLVSMSAPNFKFYHILTGFDLTLISPYNVDYNPTITIINNTHYSYSITPSVPQNFVSIRFSILIIEIDSLPAKYYFITFNLSTPTSITRFTTGYTTYLSTQTVIGCLSKFKRVGTMLGVRQWVNFHTVVVVYADNVDSYDFYLVVFASRSCPSNSIYLYYMEADTLCYDICPTNYISNTISMKCEFYIPYCKVLSATNCIQCLDTFVKAADSMSCYCPAGTTYLTGTCNTIDNCVSALVQNGVLICIFCDLTKKMILINNQCQCMTGYQSTSNTSIPNNICSQICGDGISLGLPCDDGNLHNGDGCSNTCTFQPGFVCTLNSLNKSICKSQQNINIKFLSIQKIENQNSAILSFKIQNQNLPFPIDLLLSDISVLSPSNILSITSVSQLKNGIISIMVNYNKTIQGMDATIGFNFQNTQYITQDSVINLKLISNDWPFIYADNIQALRMISYGSTTVGYVSMAILLFALPAPKFIGIQTVQIIQLFYFSILLTDPISYWSPIYKVLTPLKYSNGYHVDNFVGSDLTFDTSKPLYKKFFLLGYSNIFLNNNNITLLILFIMAITFLIVQIFRQSSQVQFLTIKKTQKNIQIQTKFYQLVKITQKVFKVCFHFCMFIMLNVIASIIMATSATLNNFLDQLSIIFNKLLLVFTILIIVLFIANNYLNILLMKLKLKQFTYRYEKKQLTHVRTNVLYLFFIGISIMCFNSFDIKGVPFSVIVLVVQLIYVFCLIKMNPYQFSIKIHRFSVVFNHVCYLIYLVFLNFNNVFHPDQLYQYIMCYYALTASTIIFILALIRLFYQYKYGNQLDQKIMKQDEKKYKDQEKQKKLKYQIDLALKIQQLQREAKLNAARHIGLNPLYRKNNQYLYQNQVEQDMKYDLLQWLQTRKNWSEEQKEQYFYKRFTEKPLRWLQEHDTIEYQKRISKIQKEKKEKSIKKMQSRLNENKIELLESSRFQQWKAQLKDEANKKKQKKNEQKHKKSTKK